MNYRLARPPDIAAMARIRAADWETEDYWTARISDYLAGEAHPRDALPSRAIYVAIEANSVAGFIAGHLTRRYKCEGELQWIDVGQEHRRIGIAFELLRHLATWFIEQNAYRICVDVQPTNIVARKFYTKHGAEELNAHWLVWKDIRSAFTTRPAQKKSIG